MFRNMIYDVQYYALSDQKLVESHNLMARVYEILTKTIIFLGEAVRLKMCLPDSQRDVIRSVGSLKLYALSRMHDQQELVGVIQHL